MNILVNMQDQGTSETPQRSSGFLKGFLMAIVFLILGGAAVGLGIMMKPDLLGLSKGQVQAQAEVDALVAEVGELLALPSDEKPTVATITDVEKLREQAFFKNAANGDKVLIYTNAKKAILYRPSEKKVLEVGAVNIRQQETPLPQVQVIPSPVPTPLSSTQP